MLLLPTFNAKLNPCPVGPAEFTPHPQGSFCGQCQRVVHDFSQSLNPRADLVAARTASPDGRVCGRFGAAQVQAAPRLSRRLRWFVAALVLVVAQGLSAREALAQVRKSIPRKPAVHHKKHTSVVKKQPIEDIRIVEESYYTSGIAIDELPVTEPEPALANKVYTYVEQMPQLPGGGGTPAVVAYIQQRVRWPEGSQRLDAEGRVFVSFTVDTTGQVHDAHILKSLHPLLDAETLRVVQALPRFTPGRQNGRLVKVSIAVPVTFRRD
jgi:TonB family protein